MLSTFQLPTLYGCNVPISGQANSRESAPNKEKRTLPGIDAGVSEFGCVAALGPEGPISAARFGNINPIPFRSRRGSAYTAGATPAVAARAFKVCRRPAPPHAIVSLRRRTRDDRRALASARHVCSGARLSLHPVNIQNGTLRSLRAD